MSSGSLCWDPKKTVLAEKSPWTTVADFSNYKKQKCGGTKMSVGCTKNCRSSLYSKMKLTRAGHLNFGFRDQRIQPSAVSLIHSYIFAIGLERVFGREFTTLTVVRKAISWRKGNLFFWHCNVWIAFTHFHFS